MYKNLIISFLAAMALSKLPCFEISRYEEKIGLIVGIATAVFIFLLFFEDLHEKWRNYRRRVQKTREIVRKLRFHESDINEHRGGA